MKDIYAPLDDYEKELIDAIENDEFVPAENQDEIRVLFQEIARNTSKKDQRMNIRMTKKDVDGLKAMALEEGIPYQTLVSSILHKYVTGRLKSS